MIIEYSNKYEEDVKNLLEELEQYISSIDKEGYNIIGDNFKYNYLKKTIEEINKYNGKMLLYEENNKIVGLIVGLINNDETNNYDFKAPKRGRITELIVSKEYRNKGIGKKLLNSMREYLNSIDCKKILIGVFAYNEDAIKFYEKNGFHTRLIDMIDD